MSQPQQSITTPISLPAEQWESNATLSHTQHIRTGMISEEDVDVSAVDEQIAAILEHKALVARFMNTVASLLFQRAAIHDNSKFGPEELASFVAAGPALKDMEYGSPEYRAALRTIKPAIEHHYSVNSHHPEFYSKEPGVGIYQMTLVDLVEMVCDWLAAVERVKNGDIWTSLEKNQSRFGYDDHLQDMLRSTVELILARTRTSE